MIDNKTSETDEITINWRCETGAEFFCPDDWSMIKTPVA